MSGMKELRGFKIGDKIISLRKDIIPGIKSLMNKKGKIINFYNQYWVEIEFNVDIMDDEVNRTLSVQGQRTKNTKKSYWVLITDLKKDNIGTGRFDREMVVEEAREVRGFKIGDKVKSLKDKTTSDEYNVKPLKNKIGKIIHFYDDYEWEIVQFNEDIIDDFANNNVRNRITNKKNVWFVKFENLKKVPNGRFDREMVIEDIERKFKAGDRVVRIDPGLNHYKEKATVKGYYEGLVIIEFDKKLSTSYANEFGIETKPGHGWSCDEHSIKKINKSTSRFVKEMVIENFKEYINEKEAPPFKVGDRVIRIKPDLKHYGEKATVKGYKPHHVVIEFDKKIGDNEDDFDGLTRVGYGWSCDERAIEKIIKPKGRFDREMVVENSDTKSINEVVEPGQETYDDVNKFSIHVTNKTEYDFIQDWAFANGYSWSGGEKKHKDEGITNYKKNTILTFDFKDKKCLHYGSLVYHQSIEGRRYWGDVVKFKSFIDGMEYDNRVKVKPSEIKKLNEVVEPGQNTSENIIKFSVNVTNEKESKMLQDWLYKNDFKWNGDARKYLSEPISMFKDKAMLVFDFTDKKIRHGSTTAKNVKAYGELYTLDEFFNLIEGDERIKVNPSSIGDI
jgi:hypothetical protein